MLKPDTCKMLSQMWRSVLESCAKYLLLMCRNSQSAKQSRPPGEVNVYYSTETPNLKQSLKSFADEFAKLQDYQQAAVERPEAKVV